MFDLHVIDGPDAGKTFAIAASGAVLLGNSKLCAVRLEDETVVARQCSLEMDGSRLRIVDLSSGSTRVNGVCAFEAFLLGGEIIRVGQTALAVRRRSGEEAKPMFEPMPTSFGRVVGESSQMRALYILLATLAAKRAPLVIQGERGTGKRLVAEELHAQGPWKDGPFVVVPRHAPVAPFVPLAQGGTLYIEDAATDEVRGLELPSDMRVIFGTRTSFGFAADVVILPPLRDREGDVAILARRFWIELGGEGCLPDDFVARVADREWAGNCRELRMAVADRLRHGAEETTSDIVEIIGGASRGTGPADVIEDVVANELPFVKARNEVMAEFERRYIDHALEKAGHNVARAAANSGIAHRYFQVLKSRRKNA